MRLSDESTTKFKIELVNKQIQKIKQTMNTWTKEWNVTALKYEQLKQENEQLRAQVTKTKEALTIANNYMPDIGHFCTCGKCKRCGTNINYAGYGYCLKCARDIIDEALSAKYEDSGLSPDEVQELAKAKADGRLVFRFSSNNGESKESRPHPGR